jgi:16S rRNA (cytosine967-C5)-methyltransferase
MSKPTNRRLSDRKLASQARACACAAAQLLWEAMVAKRPADRALSGYLRNHRECGSRDRRLISETFFGVLRWWGWLHDFAPEFTEEPPDPERIVPENYARLLLGAWLLEDAPLPPVAEVWQEQIGVSGNLSGKSLPIAQRWKALLPIRQDRTRRYELTDLVPAWCFEEIGQPCEPAMLIDWLQLRPPVWLRAQIDPAQAARELTEAEIEPRPHPARPDAIAIDPPRVNLRMLPCFRDGHLEIQDLASQTIAGVCAPKPGERWWDTCAGAGGKTLHLATLMSSKGSIVASDIRTYKLDDLKKRARRAEFSNIRCKEWKGKELPAKKGGFDGVLVDAPCTCSGTWRRNPDARWTLDREEITEFAEKQLGLLSSASGAVRSGGTLVYATCSMFGAENEGVVQTFLAGCDDFELDPFPHPLGAGVCPGQLRIWPWDGDCDAMFVARFRRK